MADKRVEKYIGMFKKNPKLMGDLVKYSFMKDANKDFPLMVHLVLNGKIPKMENGLEYIPEEDAAAQKAVRRVMSWAEYHTLYTEVLHSEIMRMYPGALDRLAQQIDDEKNPWLANKAANDIATRYDRLMQKDEGNTVTIKFEGMPEIGVPDEE